MDFDYHNLFKPTYLAELCAEYRLRPSKEYGQNYLLSEMPIQAMIAAAQAQKTDTIVEVGPGFGVLTLALAPQVKKVLAFEIEKKIEGYWDIRQKEYSNVEVVWGNVLYQMQQEVDSIPNEYKVIANVPYQITSQIFRLFLEEVPVRPTCIVTMVQKEVAERMCAKRGDMSLLAVSVQYYGTPKIVTKVSRGNFWPMPKVDSAVISIEVNQSHVWTKEQDVWFFNVVHAAFAHKRKQAWRNMSDELHIEKSVVQDVLKTVVGNEQVRAQDVTVGEWLLIAQELRVHKVKSV
jgi:16S rRNA (adenine1518-N6/adenine1519-N6)-dimethyltransferase